MSNVSMSIVGMLYNIQLLKYAGENGVAAYGVMMYVSMIFPQLSLDIPLVWLLSSAITTVRKIIRNQKGFFAKA